MSGGKLSDIGLDVVVRMREQVISKWDSFGFLEGLKGHVREDIAERYQCCKCDSTPKNNGIVPKKYIKKHRIWQQH